MSGLRYRFSGTRSLARAAGVVRRANPLCAGALALATLALLHPAPARASCGAPASAIEAENCLPGTPPSVWDMGNVGDPTIQGYGTQISVNVGETVFFKIKTDAAAYTIDIYRLGYYQGDGARRVASVAPSAALPQTQPACLSDATTGLLDCGNWAVSASWAVPAQAVSGIYLALLTRPDTGGRSHIVFVVRNDASRSDILFQASDTTWQAYNDYGGNNLYQASTPAGRAFKVSYNRPFHTRAYQSASFVFHGELPMVKWLEGNGYDVSYSTATDTDRRGALLRNHRVWMSNGHDEYWSGGERTAVEAAVAAGVHLAFFSANKIFWKTRWENSTDGTGTPYRTLVCYKETAAGSQIDPADPPTWTGTWRDPSFSPPADGGRPENALAGTLFRINGPFEAPVTITQADGQMRFWRNTSVASLGAGQVATLIAGSIGEEVDVDEDNGFRPAGLFGLSTTPITVSGQFLLDYGTLYGAGSTVHKLTLYRHPSGALVFSSNAYNWAWGLDPQHDDGASTTDVRMQQATVNLLADMGVAPVTLQPGLVPATASTDSLPPTSSIVSPLPGAALVAGQAVTVSGSAGDVGGNVAAVEVSTDGGATWHPASGRESWSYTWTPVISGLITIRSRAVDDSGNLESPSAGVTASLSLGPGCSTSSCTTIWPLGVTPSRPDAGGDSPVEVGVKFRSDVSGSITGIRFYKALGNIGTHVGSLWTSAGTRIASVTFASESASGWQQADFATPVPITAGTIYVASYHMTLGHYAADLGYFSGAGVDSPPLHALATGVSGADGVYAYGAGSTFPSGTTSGTNYWVDVVFRPPPLSSISVTPTAPVISSGTVQQFRATGTFPDGTTQDATGSVTWSSSNPAVAPVSSGGLASGLTGGVTTIAATLGSLSSNAQLTVQLVPLAITTASLPVGTLGTTYSAALSAVGGTPPYSWSLASGQLPPSVHLSAAGTLSGVLTATGTYAPAILVTDAAGRTASQLLPITVLSTSGVSLWSSSAAPAVQDAGGDGAVELGVKIRSDVAGYVTGIRFFKASTNTGTHVGNLWSSTGSLLASATFLSETASGWQQVSFANPVRILANTVYVASYHTLVGHYSRDVGFFSSVGVDTPPLHALASTTSPNGVYAYGSLSAFPSGSYVSTNYWVDVVFNQGPTATLSSLAISGAGGTLAVGAQQALRAIGTYSDGTTQDLSSQATWSSSAPAVASVAPGGLVTGVSAGTATIGAGTGGLSAQVTVSVSAAPLAVTTASVPSATVGAPYSVTLAASGGTPPYRWSIASGALPAGLGLSAGGTVSGTPTIAGTFTATVAVTDSTNTTATRAIPLAVSSAPVSLWPATLSPGNPDHGADAPVELGVKFTSDVAGRVTGIRFYKAATNTGVHVGNLWTAAGTLLASATFTGETASGWQQVSFAAPVTIAAGTTYVASYHTDVGHYSQDVGYFSTSGEDNPPLHAPSSGASGGNGLYAYGSAGTFPAGTFAAANYWVDVLFSAGP